MHIVSVYANDGIEYMPATCESEKCFRIRDMLIDSSGKILYFWMEFYNIVPFCSTQHMIWLIFYLVNNWNMPIYLH
jgi:hypothetical protein